MQLAPTPAPVAVTPRPAHPEPCLIGEHSLGGTPTSGRPPLGTATYGAVTFQHVVGPVETFQLTGPLTAPATEVHASIADAIAGARHLLLAAGGHANAFAILAQAGADDRPTGYTLAPLNLATKLEAAFAGDYDLGIGAGSWSFASAARPLTTIVTDRAVIDVAAHR